MFRLLSQIDFFRSPVTLHFRGDSRVSSKIGIFLSLSIFGLLIYSFLTSDLILKKSPFIVKETKTQNSTDQINFSQETLLTVHLEDDLSNKLIDPSIFTINFTIKHIKADKNVTMVEGEKRTISLHPCTNEDMPQNRSDVFFILNLHNAFCLDEKEFKMQGHWDEVNVFYAIAELYPCENQTSNGMCKSQAEIDEFLSKKKFFGIIFHDAYLDLKDYETPMKIKYHIESASIDPLYTKRRKLYIKTTKIFTDNGIFYSENTMYENITFDRSEFDFSTRKINTPLFEYVLFSSRNTDETHRRYQKIQDVLASLSGEANFLIIICSILPILQNKLHLLHAVLNYLYLFPQKYSKNKKNKNCKEEKKKLSTEIKINETHPQNKKHTNFIENQISIGDSKIRSLSFQGLKSENEKKIVFETQVKTNERLPSQRSCIIPDCSAMMSPCERDYPYFGYILNKVIERQSIESPHYSKEEIKISENKKKLLQIKSEESPIGSKHLLEEKNGRKKSIFQNSKSSKIFKLFNSKEKVKMNDNENRLKIGFFEYCKYLIMGFFGCKKTERQKIISQAFQSYSEEVDLTKILAKIDEIEKLKVILLDEDEGVLFNFLSKPIWIPESEKNETNTSLLTQTLLKHKIKTTSEDFMKRFRNVKTKSLENEMDSRLIALVEDDLEKFKII